MSFARFATRLPRNFLSVTQSLSASRSAYSTSGPWIRSVTRESGVSLVPKSQSCCITHRAASGVSAGIHTNVDRDLVTFLEGEIEAEKEQTRVPKNGPGVPGYQISSKGSSLTLVRKVNNETITIRLNVNGSVDTDGPSDEEMELQQSNPQQDSMPLGDMKAKPDFVVEISKSDGQILAFNCRVYADSEIPADQPDADKFEIEGFALLNAEDVDEYGDWDENLYVGDAGIVDGQMYDLLMNFLDSRGIGNEFVDNLVDYATYYEHTRFVDLLSGIKSFVSAK